MFAQYLAEGAHMSSIKGPYLWTMDVKFDQPFIEIRELRPGSLGRNLFTPRHHPEQSSQGFL
jgi:hypothetical protein